MSNFLQFGSNLAFFALWWLMALAISTTVHPVVVVEGFVITPPPPTIISGTTFGRAFSTQQHDGTSRGTARGNCDVRLWSNNNDLEPTESNDKFDGKGFASYLAPYALALMGSVATTYAVFKYVLLDY